MFKPILFLFIGFILGSLAMYAYSSYQSIPTSNSSLSLNNPITNNANTELANNFTSAQTTTPILMYHHVKINTTPDNAIEAGLDVTPANFEEQMAYLYAKGYRTTDLDNLFTASADRRVVITFDDGYNDVIQNAYPILKQMNYKATVFLIINKIDTDGYLTWADVKFLEQEGWSVGSHTLSHPNLTTASLAKAREEVVNSKTVLDSKLSHPVTFFCYPSGQFNEAVINIVKEAGYQGAVTTIFGADNQIANIYQLKRVRVGGRDSLIKFIEKLTNRSASTNF